MRVTLCSLISAASLTIFAALAGTATAATAPSGPSTATGTGGAAATVETLATQAAIDTLRHGANAVDAAVTAAAVLGVTEPFSSGIGGGGFLLLRTAGGTVTTIDQRETAPAAMRADSFWENGAALPFTLARYSGLSVGVPGTVAGWAKSLDHYGTISLAEALQPAIRIAREGFVIDGTFFAQTQENVDFFDDVPASAALFLDPDGTPKDVGTVFRNPDLARAYERIAHFGAKGFYSGAIADALVETVQSPPVAPTANHVWRPGLMTMRDLHTYVAPERAPTRVSYRGLDVYGMGPPSSGGSAVGEALNILEGYSLATETRERQLHLFLEASRYAFADRGAYLGDADFVRVPLRGLLSDGFAATRRALIKETAAAGAVAAGDPWPFEDALGLLLAGASADHEGLSTTHLSVSDRWGNVVSYTFTIESTGGAGLVVPGWGFLLNNELTDFDYALLHHPNSVAGGKRPRSSMAPTIVTQGGHGHTLLTVGSPGGSTIITTVLQLLLDRLDAGMTLPQAIADPRATQRNGATTQAEPAFRASPLAAALEARGHRFVTNPEIGAATGIEFLPAGGVIAAAEPTRRGGGSAMVETPAP
jgi:gamma-glutamyltranspeptidase / glutathione hydrolase